MPTDAERRLREALEEAETNNSMTNMRSHMCVLPAECATADLCAVLDELDAARREVERLTSENARLLSERADSPCGDRS